MDDSKNKNPHEVPEDTGTQPTSEEVSATVPDGAEATAAAAEAERAAELEEMMVPAVGSDQTAIAEAAPVENAPPGRDRAAEWTELAAAHPEIVGTTLPDDIYRAIMTSELTPLRVYESMMLKRQTDRISQLEAEIAQLRQNAETAVRAPVVGAAGAPVNAEPEDDFLRGFNSYR